MMHPFYIEVPISLGASGYTYYSVGTMAAYAGMDIGLERLSLRRLLRWATRLFPRRLTTADGEAAEGAGGADPQTWTQALQRPRSAPVDDPAPGPRCSESRPQPSVFVSIRWLAARAAGCLARGSSRRLAPRTKKGPGPWEEGRGLGFRGAGTQSRGPWGTGQEVPPQG